jgi:hypothetical protein
LWDGDWLHPRNKESNQQMSSPGAMEVYRLWVRHWLALPAWEYIVTISGLDKVLEL